MPKGFHENLRDIKVLKISEQDAIKSELPLIHIKSAENGPNDELNQIFIDTLSESEFYLNPEKLNKTKLPKIMHSRISYPKSSFHPDDADGIIEAMDIKGEDKKQIKPMGNARELKSKKKDWSRYVKRFNPKWLKNPGCKDWILEATNPLKAGCRFCRAEIRAHFGDVRKHAQREKHINNMKKNGFDIVPFPDAASNGRRGTYRQRNNVKIKEDEISSESDDEEDCDDLYTNRIENSNTVDESETIDYLITIHENNLMEDLAKQLPILDKGKVLENFRKRITGNMDLKSETPIKSVCKFAGIGVYQNDILSNCLSHKVNQRENYVIMVDVAQFSPTEIKVSLDVYSRVLKVEACHEEKSDDHGTAYRHFKRTFNIPKILISDDLINTSISSDGVLFIQIPLPAKKKGQKLTI